MSNWLDDVIFAPDRIIPDGLFLQLGTINPATGGQIRFENGGKLRWRNAANTTNIGIELDSNNNLVLGAGSPPNITELVAQTSVDSYIAGTRAMTTYQAFPSCPAYAFDVAFGDGTGTFAIVGATVPTTARNGMAVIVLGGGAGPGNQVGGEVQLVAGSSTGAGAKAGVSVQDETLTNISRFINDGVTPRFEMDVANIQWGSGVSSPVIWQANQTTASTNGQKLWVHAQNATGATSTGGALDLGPGSGTTAGGLGRLISGSGAGRVSWNDTGLGFYGQTPIAKPSYGVANATTQNQIDGLYSALGTLGLITDNRSNYADSPFITVTSPTTSGTVTSNTVETVGTLGAGITRTLPAAPNTGDWYRVNAGPSAATSNVTIALNGKNLNGSASNRVLNTAYATLYIVYNGTEWRTLD